MSSFFINVFSGAFYSYRYLRCYKNARSATRPRKKSRSWNSVKFVPLVETFQRKVDEKIGADGTRGKCKARRYLHCQWMLIKYFAKHTNISLTISTNCEHFFPPFRHDRREIYQRNNTFPNFSKQRPHFNVLLIKDSKIQWGKLWKTTSTTDFPFVTNNWCQPLTYLQAIR